MKLYTDNNISNDDFLNDLNLIQNSMASTDDDTGCQDFSCGLHYHISSDQILYTYSGLLFLINLIIQWDEEYQAEFVEEYNYQETKNENHYAPKNELPYDVLDKLDIIKSDLIARIKTKDIEFTKLEEYFEEICIINKNYDRPYLTIVEDEKYIHIEFRGQYPYDIKNNIKKHIAAIKRMYTKVIQMSIEDYTA